MITRDGNYAIEVDTEVEVSDVRSDDDIVTLIIKDNNGSGSFNLRLSFDVETALGIAEDIRKAAEPLKPIQVSG